MLSHRSPVAALLAFAVPIISAARSYTPTHFALGNNVTIDGLREYKGNSVTLTPKDNVLTLDYSLEVGGWPYIETDSPSSPVQIELKYSESFMGLGMAYGDGPWLFTNPLGNSFRTETFNITDKGRMESFLLQGGQRWQSITLLSNSSVTIHNIGFRPSVDIKSTDQIPGSFQSSKSIHDRVWDLGARAVQAACVEKGSQRSPWEVTDDGMYIRGQYPAVSAKANDFANYTLEFSTKIAQGGTGWRVAGGPNGGYGAYFVLTATEPELLSAEIDPLPRNSLTAGYGFSIINQAILPSADPKTYNISTSIVQDKWYRIKTVINGTGYAISVDDKQVAFVDSAPFKDFVNTGWGSPSLEVGTFGFGPYMNQAAYFKDVNVHAKNGSQIYSNPLDSEDALPEYAIQTNEWALCLDGPKRDRAAWIGDFAHTAKILAVSSGRYDFIESTINFEFDWQLTEGDGKDLVPIQAFLGAAKEYRHVYYPSEYGEADYQHLFLLTLGDYFAMTGDLDLMRKHWTGLKKLIATLNGRWLDPRSGLLAGDNAPWFLAKGTQNATAPTALYAAGLNQIVHIAQLLGDEAAEKEYSTLATNLNKAINSLLWSDDLGSYATSLDQSNITSMLATAFAIRAGAADTDRATKSIESLEKLLVNIGYKDDATMGSDDSVQLSPNTQGFLLEALFLANLDYGVKTETVMPALKNMLEKFWPNMVTQNEYFTGTSWEYMLANGEPWAGGFDSLGHPWGGAPTYIYSNYILGVRPEWNEKKSKYQWVFDPALDIAQGLGLDWAKGRVPLPNGGYIEASWSTSGCKSAKCRSNPKMTSKVVNGGDVELVTKQ